MLAKDIVSWKFWYSTCTQGSNIHTEHAKRVLIVLHYSDILCVSTFVTCIKLCLIKIWGHCQVVWCMTITKMPLDLWNSS